MWVGREVEMGLEEEEKWKKEQEKQHRETETSSDQFHLVILRWT
jgi:hypothetical protein